MAARLRGPGRPWEAEAVFGRVKEQPSPQSLVGTSSPAPGDDSGGGSGGPSEGLILVIFMVITVAASVLVLHSAAANSEKDPIQKAARGEIQGLSELSFFSAANLRKALAKVSDSRWPLVISVRLAAARVDVTARDKDGYRKYMSINPAYKVDISDDNVGEDKAIAVSQIDTGAPERMIRAVSERTHMSPNAVDYLVTDADNEKDSAWYMFLDQGPARVRQWVTTSSGTDLRHPGEPSQLQKDATAQRERELKRQQARQQRHFKCIAKAFTPAAYSRCDRKFPI
jgi:hypothetical protein